MGEDKLTENQVRQSGIYKVISTLFSITNNSSSLDIIHKKIASGLKHNLAIYYYKNIDDEIVPCLAGWGNNSENQLGMDITGATDKYFANPRPIYLEYNRQQYYPLSISCGLNHSLILAVRCGVMQDYIRSLNEYELQVGIGINQPEVIEQLQQDFLKDTKLFIAGDIKYSEIEAIRLEQQQQKNRDEIENKQTNKIVENYFNGLSIQINNHTSKLNSLFASPIQSSTQLPLLSTTIHQENKQFTFANQLSVPQDKKNKSYFAKQASREEEFDIDEDKTNQMKNSFEIHFQSNSKANFNTVIDTIVDLSQIKSLNSFSVMQISCGWDYCMILSHENQIFTWGDNLFGNLGTGDTSYRVKPSLVLLEYGKILYARYIDCYAQHSAAISIEGQLYTWGQGQHGQIGNGRQGNMALPTEVKGILENKITVQVSCGVFHTACVTNDGFAYTWGANTNGQLGQDYSNQIRPNPEVVAKISNYFVIQVVCGYNTTYFFTQNGRVYGCGSNTNNKLGLDYKQYQSYLKTVYIPIELKNSFLKGVSFSKINDVYIYQISSSLHSTLALSNKGYLTSWGLNHDGILGRPISTLNSEEFCQLDAEYDDKIEGYYPKRYENMMIPNRVQINYLGYKSQIFCPIQNQSIFKAKKKDFISSEFVDIKLGNFHSMGLTNAGEVYVWGSNSLSQHGCEDSLFTQTYSDQNTSKIKINVSSLIITTLPTLVKFFDIQENRRVSYIACGADYCMAIENRRKIYGWGRNESAQLGIGATSPIVQKPTQVQGLEGLLMKQIACGVEHTLFLSDDGSVFSCGSYVDGRLGLGQRDAIQLFPMKIQSLYKIEKIACGQSHSLALGEDIILNEDDSFEEQFQTDSFNKKVIYSWGNAFESKLGHGEKENLFEPSRIQTNYNFTNVFAGNHHSAAIDKDHNLIVWGPFQYFGYQKPEEKNSKNKRTDANEFTRPTIHPKQQMLQQVQNVALGDKYSIVLNNINQVFQWGVFDREYESKLNENKNVTRNQINEALMTTITRLNNPTSALTSIAVSSNHAALISKGQLFTWGYDMNTGRLSTGYEFYDQIKEEQKMIDEVYDDASENQLKEKAVIIDLNNKVDNPQNCSYLNRYLQDQLVQFNAFQKQKVAYQKRVQQSKQNNSEQEKYRETSHQTPSDFQVEEELEDEDDEEGGGGGLVKEINPSLRTNKIELENKMKREIVHTKPQTHQTIISTKGNQNRHFTRMGTIKKTVLYETSMAYQVNSSSKIFDGSFNQNTKEFKKFKTLEKIYQKNSQTNTPTERRPQQKEIQQQQEEFKEEIDPFDYYTDPINNKSLYQEIMQQGKPELMSIIKDEDGYGIFSGNKIIELYDKVINISNEINLYYLKFKEFLDNQNKIKNVIKSKTFKRISEPPFNVADNQNQKIPLPYSYSNHKLLYSFLMTELTSHPCYLLKIYEKGILKEDEYIKIVTDIFQDMECDSKMLKVYLDICKKIISIDIKSKSLKNKNFTLDLNKETTVSYTFVKLYMHLYNQFTAGILINRNFRLFIIEKIREFAVSQNYTHPHQQLSMLVFEKSSISNILNISNEDQLKQISVSNAFKVTQFFDTILHKISFHSKGNESISKPALPEPIREILQFLQDIILKKIGEENEDKLNQKVLKQQTEEHNIINTYLKSQENIKDNFYKKLMGKKKIRKLNNGHENITDLYHTSMNYVDDKITVSLKTLSKITKLLYKNPIYVKSTLEEDFINTFIVELQKDKESMIYNDLDINEDKKVNIILKSRFFYHFSTEQIKRCNDCGTYLPSSHLKSSDRNLLERFSLYNPEQIESLTIQFIKRIPNKSTYDQIFGGKISFEKFLNEQIIQFKKRDLFLDSKMLLNFKKKFENNVALMNSEQAVDIEAILLQKNNPSLEYLKSLKRILDKKTMQILSYYQKMQNLYKVYFELKLYFENQIKMIPRKQAQQFIMLNNCHYGFANTEVQCLLDSHPLSVVEKMQSQLHSKSMSTDIYTNIDLFSKYNLNTQVQKMKEFKINGNFLELFMFGEYSFNALKLKKAIKDVDDKIVNFVTEYLDKSKIKSKAEVESCLFYIISNFGSDQIQIDLVYKGQGTKLLNYICRGHFKQLRIERYEISIMQLKDMRKQNLLEDSSKIFIKFGYTVFYLKGLLKLIGKIEDNQSVYEQIYFNNSL